MIGKINNILTGTQDAVVQSIKNTQKLLDKVQARLATGKDVNSAIDNPQNFFLSLSLSQNAADFRKLLDGIAQNIEAIKTTITGVDAILNLVDLADTMLQNAVEELYAGGRTTLVSELSDEDVTAILGANPGVVYSPITRSFYQLGAPANGVTATANALAATLVEPAGVSGVAGVTGHLANITSAAENIFVDALAPGNAYIGGSDAGVEGTWVWANGPEAGQPFWQGTAGGSAVGGSFANWGGGEPNNSGNEDFAHLRPDGRWNDITGATVYNYIVEWDSSLFLPPVDPNLVERAAVYKQQYLEIMEQIDALAKDSHYRGIRLLKEDNLRTNFNPDRTNFLITQGIDATSGGLGFVSIDFLRLYGVTTAQEKTREAREELRDFSRSLANDFNVISVRFDFTRGTINVHEEGAELLVVADPNEAGAELLALQTRRQLQSEALRLSTQSSVSQILEG